MCVVKGLTACAHLMCGGAGWTRSVHRVEWFRVTESQVLVALSVAPCALLLLGAPVEARRGSRMYVTYQQ